MKQMKFFLLLWMVILCSCNQNNGDIGDFYGMWKLKRVEINGEMINHNDEYMSFQGTVVGLRVLYGDHSEGNCFGYYDKINDSIKICLRQGVTEIYKNFNFNPDYEGSMTLPGGGEQAIRDFLFKLEVLKASEMILSSTGTVYYFAKY